MNRQQRDVIIIGGGLAGSSAAMQAARSGLNVLVLTRPGEKGYWSRVIRVSHFPAFPEPISGHEIIERTRKQAEHFGAAFGEFEVVSTLLTESNTFQLKGSDSQMYEAPAIIVASGIRKEDHFLVGEKELMGKGVYYSVYNTADLLKHQATSIIGKTNEAGLAAIYLSRFAEKIYFIVPSSKLDVQEKTFKNLESIKRIEILFSSSIKRLNGTNELHSVTILSAGSERELKVRSAFIYTHPLKSQTSFVSDLAEIDKDTGRLKVNNDLSSTRPGIFACGDVLCGSLQHPAVSATQGIIAAMNVEKYLNP